MEIGDENLRLKIIIDNLIAIFQKDSEKFHKYLEEIKEDTIYLTNKLNQTVDKAENSIQHYELLFYEVGSIKKQLISTGRKISQKTINDILIIKNPNDAIFLLMKMFFRILSGSSPLNASISWEIIQEQLTYSLYHKYLQSLETNFKPLSKEELDDAMPFSVNYEKITQLLGKFGNAMITVLDFLKVTVEYNIKTNIIKNLYASNLSKNAKVNSLQNEIFALEGVIKEATHSSLKMEEEMKELTRLTEKDNKLLAFNLIKRYKIDERYNVLIEIARRKRVKPKYIIKLKARYKERDSFINAIIKSRRVYDEGSLKEADPKALNIILNSNYANAGDRYSFALDNNHQPPKNRNGYNYFYPKSFLSYSEANQGNQDCGYLENYKSYGSTGYKDSAEEGGRISHIKKLSIPDKGLKEDELNLHGGAERTQRTKGTEKEKDDIYNELQLKLQLKTNNLCLNPLPLSKRESNAKPVRERNISNRLLPKHLTLDSDIVEFDTYYCCK